jgi:fibronectin type 3 domain-containing protein
MPAPQNLKAEVAAQGITLSWTGRLVAREVPGISYFYRVYRREQGSSTETVAGEVSLGSTEQATLLDRTFEWQKTYEYRVTAVTTVGLPGRSPAQVEGDDSPSISAFANDVFPPAVPGGLQAVFSGVGQQPFIDLTWSPDTDADLAGYNVYRREEGTQFVKLNAELVKTPAFHDNTVEPGKKYLYAVSAVDLRGNESARSEEAAESVPVRNSRSMELRRPVRRAQTYLPQAATRTSSALERTT